MMLNNMQQGSPEWLALVANTFGGSEAAAMLGMSPHKSRSALVREKAMGVNPNVSEFQQKLFDRGYKAEEMARPTIEALLGYTLKPKVFVDGKLRASVDGATEDGAVIWECKLANQDNFAAVKAGNLLEMYMPQCQHNLMLSKAERLLFTVFDDATGEHTSMWVDPDFEWFQRLRYGWDQFEKDVTDCYAPEPMETREFSYPVENLLSISIRASGDMAFTDDLSNAEVKLANFISGLNLEPESDEDFAALDAAVKTLKLAEKALIEAEEFALSQSASVTALRARIGSMKSLSSEARLSMEKLVDCKKKAIREGIARDAQARFLDKAKELEQSIKPHRLQTKAPDFAAAMRNKRTKATLKESAEMALANGCAALAREADGIKANLDAYNAVVGDYGYLFRDLDALVRLPASECSAVVVGRIEAQKAKEAAARAEAEQRAAEKFERMAQQATDTPKPSFAPSVEVVWQTQAIAKTRAELVAAVELAEIALQKAKDELAAFDARQGVTE